jgi:hypothetical protein
MMKILKYIWNKANDMSVICNKKKKKKKKQDGKRLVELQNVGKWVKAKKENHPKDPFNKCQWRTK